MTSPIEIRHNAKHATPRKGAWSRLLVAFALRISNRLLRRGWRDMAIIILKKTIEYEPGVLITRVCLSRAAFLCGDDAFAASVIQPEIVDRMSDTLQHSCRIADIYMRLEDYSRAEHYLRIALAERGESPYRCKMIGDLFRLQGKTDDAVASFLRAATLEHRKNAKLVLLKLAATSLADAGRVESEEIYNRILEIDRNDTFACFGIVDCRRKWVTSDPFVEKLRQMVTDPSIESSQKSHLHYALGKVYDNCGDAGMGFSHLLLANRIRSSNSPRCDIAERRERVRDRCRFFTRETICRLSRYGCQEEGLVCVVGMPRSGTTLTEQILGSHSSARPLGERNDFFRAAHTLPRLLRTKVKYPDCCSNIGHDEVRNIWESILGRMKRVAGSCQWMITKLPENFFEIGLIKILFPKAKIINVERNPCDVGLSCFMQNFRHIPYSRDVGDIAEALKQYKEMMDHWNTVLPPSSIYNISYECLVSDPENVVRGMCGFIGLTFEEASLRFYDTSRSVKTCSRWQVRRPIYRSSLRRSDAYREFLGPLVELESTSVPVLN